MKVIENMTLENIVQTVYLTFGERNSMVTTHLIIWDGISQGRDFFLDMCSLCRKCEVTPRIFRTSLCP